MTTSTPTPTAPHRARRAVAITLVILAALVAAFFLFVYVYADWLWFQQLGFGGVLVTQWFGRAVLFVLGFLAMAVPTWLCIRLAYRLRPVYARLSAQLDRYQEAFEPLRRLAMWGVPVFFGLFAGFSAAAQWESAMLWLNGVPTGTVDPQFQIDTSFYLFTLPFLAALVGFLSAVTLVCLLVTAVTTYLYGSIRIVQRELRISRPARIQLAVLAGLYLLLQAVSLWLDRYRTLSEGGGMDRIVGPGYTETHATIPGLTILSVAAALVAIAFFVTAVIGRWRYPLIATALLIVSGVVVGIVYPWILNTFQVRPNQLAYEQPYYQRNIDETKAAYGLAGLEQSDFTATTNAAAGQLRADAGTTAQIRIMDPAIISPTVSQLQQFRPYYQFANPLDVDRYEIDGQSQDTVVSVRELNVAQLATSGTTWQNSSLVYTHGYGLVVAAGNERTTDGDPVFLEQNIPASGFLSDQEDFEPRVYFGEKSPQYSIVGAPAGTPPLELDYPAGSNGSNETKTTFEGDGGPSVGNVFNRLVYAIKFQSEQILFSDYLNQDSQILYDRDPKTRISKVAPYLTLDSDPYPTVVDGRIKWVVDAYTTSATSPYSQTTSLSAAIADSNNESPRFATDTINYMRNSVKATVDAYDGKVTLYAWDPGDPILQTWEKVYPGTLHPISEMSGDLMSHVRYPTDLLKVQRAMLGTYHVDDAQSFYQRDNVWTTPNDPQDSTKLQPPYYLTMQMPGQSSPTYSMFTTFIPAAQGANARNVLMGYLAADSNAGSVAGQKDPDYGKLRMLVISAATTVPGPGQVQNTFNSNPLVSSQINILKQGQSEVLNGNLLTLPVGGGLLYVQPVFVQSSQGTQLPQLRKVLVAFGDKIAFENTLNEALDELFGGNSGATTGDTNVLPDPSSSASPGSSASPSPSTSGGTTGSNANNTEYQATLQEAQQAMTERSAALQAGDWAAYGAADAKLTAAVQKLIQLGG